MTKIFLIDDPANPEFARFAAVGTWSPGIVCPECRGATSLKVTPLLVQWDIGSDKIGDFSWSMYTCIVTEKVVRSFREDDLECEFRAAEVIAPTERMRKRDARVPFPYEGPKLKWLVANRVVNLDEEINGIAIKRICTTCCRIYKTVKTNGIVIDQSNLGDASIFRIASNGRSDAIFVTEDAKLTIESHGFTNIAFREAGIVRA